MPYCSYISSPSWLYWSQAVCQADSRLALLPVTGSPAVPIILWPSVLAMSSCAARVVGLVMPRPPVCVPTERMPTASR